MPTIDADARVVESERTWDYIDKRRSKISPTDRQAARRRRPANTGTSTARFAALVRISLDCPGCRRRGQAHRTRHEYAARNPRDGKRAGAAQAYGRARHRRASALSDHVHRADRRQARVEIPISKGYNRWLADIHAQGQGRLRWICVLPLLDMSAAPRRAQILRCSTAPAASSCAASKASA